MVPCSVVELRQYTLHPGRRGELVALFERELVETQEAAGIRVLGQFEDMEQRPLRLVPLPDMPARRELPASTRGRSGGRTGMRRTPR
jgi:hypothetical protein